jgi:hypothetical protein
MQELHASEEAMAWVSAWHEHGGRVTVTVVFGVISTCTTFSY